MIQNSVHAARQLEEQPKSGEKKSSKRRGNKSRKKIRVHFDSDEGRGDNEQRRTAI